jgi:hypothetical protein
LFSKISFLWSSSRLPSWQNIGSGPTPIVMFCSQKEHEFSHVQLAFKLVYYWNIPWGWHGGMLRLAVCWPLLCWVKFIQWDGLYSIPSEFGVDRGERQAVSETYCSLTVVSLNPRKETPVGCYQHE